MPVSDIHGFWCLVCIDADVTFDLRVLLSLFINTKCFNRICVRFTIFFLITSSQFASFFLSPAPGFDEMHVWSQHFFHFLTPKIPVPIKRTGLTVTEKNYCIVCFLHSLLLPPIVPA